MKLVFLTFADKRYYKSLKRLKTEIQKFPFDEYYFLDETNLPKGFLQSLHYKKYRRGFGYWKWKSFIVKRQLEKLNDGDILFYSDAGIHWNANGMNRFMEYVHLLSEGDKGDILAFQEPFIEKDWTKGDVLAYLNCYDNVRVTSTWQLRSGTFAIKKSMVSMKIINRWDDISQNHFYLLTDKESIIPNLYGFIEHRHDQSTWSVIVKQYKHIEISWEETNVLKDKDWANMDKYPIHTIRSKFKELSFCASLRRKLTAPYRLLIGQYLVLFEHFKFREKNPRF